MPDLNEYRAFIARKRFLTLAAQAHGWSDVGKAHLHRRLDSMMQKIAQREINCCNGEGACYVCSVDEGASRTLREYVPAKTRPRLTRSGRPL